MALQFDGRAEESQRATIRFKMKRSDSSVMSVKTTLVLFSNSFYSPVLPPPPSSSLLLTFVFLKKPSCQELKQ